MATTAVQSPIAADTEAIIGVDGAVAARDSALSVGGTQNRNNLGGEYSASAGSTITVNDPTVLSKALEALQANNKSFSETLRNLAEDSTKGLTALAESKQTDGLSSLGKIVLMIVALGVGGWALVTYFRTK